MVAKKGPFSWVRLSSLYPATFSRERNALICKFCECAPYIFYLIKEQQYEILTNKRISRHVTKSDRKYDFLKGYSLIDVTFHLYVYINLYKEFHDTSMTPPPPSSELAVRASHYRSLPLSPSHPPPI